LIFSRKIDWNAPPQVRQKSQEINAEVILFGIVLFSGFGHYLLFISMHALVLFFILKCSCALKTNCNQEDVENQEKYEKIDKTDENILFEERV